MLELVEREQDSVIMKYKIEVGEYLPKQIEDDPFGLFALFKSMVCYEKRNTKVEDLLEEIEFLKEQIQFKD